MKNILLGISGGIAAYKAVNIVSILKKKGYNVDVIMTKNATEFISPLTLETISKSKVVVDMFEEKSHIDVEHISMAEKADLVLIAPATYNIIGKVASGIADDMLSTVISATKAPVYFALAMNNNMYDNPILLSNIDKLRKLEYNFIEADEGKLACNTYAKGRLKNEREIVDIVEKHFHEKILNGKKLLITAGRTEEEIDPVRVFTNRSTGKMGYALAEAARNMGADVTLISGPTNLDVINGIKIIKVKTALEMYEASISNYSDKDIIIMSAAVADYRIKDYSSEKIKKTDGNLILEFVRNPDILKEISTKVNKNQFLLGFAAESSNIKENAIKKLKSKNLNMIIANSTEAFSSEENKVYIIKSETDIKELNIMPKKELAYEILKNINLNIMEGN